MLTLSQSSSATTKPLFLPSSQNILSLKKSHDRSSLHFTTQSSLLHFRQTNSRLTSNCALTMKNCSHQGRRRGLGLVCYAAPLAPQNLQLLCTISSAVLMLAKGTAIQKSFLVPLLALQAPASVVSWIRGNYGIWTAFLALLVRLFFYIPGELELPFIALLLVLVAPYEFMKLRGTQEGIILSLVIAAFLAFQHFSRAGNLQRAFDRGSLIATIAIVCVVSVPCLLLI